MDKYLELPATREKKLSALISDRDRVRGIRKTLLFVLRGTATVQITCILACKSTGVAVPGLKGEAERSQIILNENTASLRKALESVNRELTTLQARITRLESPEYQDQIAAKAVAQASRYADLIVDTHKKQQERVNASLRAQIQALREKDKVTEEDITELEEAVTEAAESTPEVPASLLQEIRTFRRRQQLKPLQKKEVEDTALKDSLVSMLTKELAARRKFLEDRPEDG